MKPRALVVAASEMTVRAFLGPQLRAMQEHYDVTVVVNSRATDLLRDLGVAGTMEHIPLGRAISIPADIRALFMLTRLMHRQRFDLVHSMTPKAGFLAMLAARFSQIPIRIHTFTGQVWATRTAVSRAILKLADRTIARCATFTLADSPSQRAFLIRERIAAPDRIAVLGSGSVCGVDVERFRPDPIRRRHIREELRIPETSVVILFVGRLTRDKGVLDFAKAFAALAACPERASASRGAEHGDLHAVVVGPDEQGLRSAMTRACASQSGRLHFLDYTNVPEAIMAASDVLCLPSYREGFGNVVIEAAAVGLPAVASRIYGLVDAVADERTGLLHEPGDIADLTVCLRRVAGDLSLRHALGSAARDRVARDFAPSLITSGLLDLYARLAADSSDESQGRWYRRFGKRAFDAVSAAAAIVLLLPLLAAVALIVRTLLGAPVLFWHSRPGLNGVPFWLVKFRTMTDRRDRAGTLLPDRPCP